MMAESSDGELVTEPICPACDREFASVRGMRVHHTKVHGAPLPNRECRDCGTRFYDQDGQRRRCDDCKIPNTANARWEHGNTESTCLECGASFLYYPSEKAGLFCPACVQDADVTCLPPRPKQRNSRTTVDCAHCDARLEVFDHRLAEQDDFFCDRACYTAWLAEQRRQEGVWSASDNPNWQDGADWSGRYGAGWSRARNQALDRDAHTCQRCGASRADLGQNPDVHHLEPVRTFEEPAAAHTLENLVSLCRACHIEVERATISGGLKSSKLTLLDE